MAIASVVTNTVGDSYAVSSSATNAGSAEAYLYADIEYWSVRRLWKNYHQTVQRSTLNKLTTDQQEAQIKKLQERMQADSAAAVRQMQADSTAILQATSFAHTQGLWQGAGIGVGATLLSFGLRFGLRKLRRNFSVTQKPKARAASA